jgi:hypothetical protein
MRGRHFRRGALVVLGMFVGIAIVLLVVIGLSYDGKCGGFMPWLAGARPCSLLTYVTGNVALLAALLGFTYWPIALALLLLPPFVGYLLDRRDRGREGRT